MVSVQPLDSDLQNIGDSIQGVTCDTSAGGMGFLCNDAIRQDHCRISLPGSCVCVIAKIRHSRLIGGVPVVFKYGVEYLPNTTDDSDNEIDQKFEGIPVLTLL